MQKLFKIRIGNWYPAVVEIKKGPFFKFYCFAQFRAVSEMIKATMIDWMCNPDNSAKAAPFLFLADALFTLLTVKVILFVILSLFFVIGRIVDVLLIVAFFVGIILSQNCCFYSL